MIATTSGDKETDTGAADAQTNSEKVMPVAYHDNPWLAFEPYPQAGTGMLLHAVPCCLS